MKTNVKIKELYRNASNELSLINQASQSAAFEGMSFIVCRSVKECMYDFLHCYLLVKKDAMGPANTLSDLVSHCASFDDRFKQIDLKWVNCKDLDLETTDDQYCSSAQKVQHCIGIINGIKEIVDDAISKTGVPVA